MEVVDLEKKAIEDTMEHHSIYTSNDETVNADASGNVTNGEVEEIKQNQWQFSDEGKCKSLKKKKKKKEKEYSIIFCGKYGLGRAVVWRVDNIKLSNR